MKTKYKLEYEFDTNRDYKIVDEDIITLNKNATFESCVTASGSETFISTIYWNQGNLQKTTGRTSGSGTWIYLHPDGVDGIKIGRYDLILEKGNSSDLSLAFGNGSSTIDNIIWPHINPSSYYHDGRRGQKIFMTFRWDGTINKYIGMASPWYGDEIGTIVRTVTTYIASNPVSGSGVSLYSSSIHGPSYFDSTDEDGIVTFNIPSGGNYTIWGGNMVGSTLYTGSVSLNNPTSNGNTDLTLTANPIPSGYGSVSIKTYESSDYYWNSPNHTGVFEFQHSGSYSFDADTYILQIPPENQEDFPPIRTFSYWVRNNSTPIYSNPLTGTHNTGSLLIALIYDE
jgi:hypothetical protein